MISLHNMLPFELTKDTPYLALSGELWSVFYEYLNRNWSCYKGFLLYIYTWVLSKGVMHDLKGQCFYALFLGLYGQPCDLSPALAEVMGTNKVSCLKLHHSFNSYSVEDLDFKDAVFNLVLLICVLNFSYGNVQRWIPLELTDDTSTLVQVMAWCHQAQTLTWTNVDPDLCHR